MNKRSLLLFSILFIFITHNLVAEKYHPQQVKYWKEVEKKEVGGKDRVKAIKSNIKANKTKDPKDYEKTIRLYIKSAEKGNYNSQIRLAVIYSSDKKFVKYRDKKKAFNWYLKAAKNTHKKSGAKDKSKAYAVIGNYYKNGEIVEQDYSEASLWYRKINFNGNYAKNNLKKAKSWLDLLKTNIAYKISAGNSTNGYDSDKLEMWIETDKKQSDTSSKAFKIKLKSSKGEITKTIRLNNKCIFIKATGLDGVEGKDGRNKTSNAEATPGTDGGRGGNGGNVVIHLSKDIKNPPPWLIFDISPGLGAKGGKGGIISKGKKVKIPAKDEYTYTTEMQSETVELPGFSPDGRPRYKTIWRSVPVIKNNYQPAKTVTTGYKRAADGKDGEHGKPGKIEIKYFE